jgi:hypothetical protein
MRDMDASALKLHTAVNGLSGRGELVTAVQNPSIYRGFRQDICTLFVQTTRLAGACISERLLVDAPDSPIIVAAFQHVAHACSGCTAGDFVDIHAIHNDEARRFWISRYTAKRLAVPLEDFIRDLGEVTGVPLSLSEAESFRSVVDDAGCKLITVHKFNEFVNAFGTTLRSAVQNMERSMQASVCRSLVVPVVSSWLCAVQEAWFHGFLSFDEANEVLRCCPVGTFLIRFSQSSPTSLALAFVAPDQSVKQVRIDAKPGHGFIMDGWCRPPCGVGRVVVDACFPGVCVRQTASTPVCGTLLTGTPACCDGPPPGASRTASTSTASCRSRKRRPCCKANRSV